MRNTMAEILALHETRWMSQPTSRVSQLRCSTIAKRCGSLQEQYVAFCAAQEALEKEQAMLIRLPKQKDEISPSGFIALKTLTETSAGKGMRPHCQSECAGLLDSHDDLAAIMDWLEQMPGNWGNDMTLQTLHDTRSGHSVLGIRMKNIILFRSSLHALEAKRGARLLRLVQEGARMPQTQAVAEIFEGHQVLHTPYSAIIAGPWG